MRAISLLFHDVYASDPAESGFVSAAANRYKLPLAAFDAQLAHIASLRRDAPVAADSADLIADAARKGYEATLAELAWSGGSHPPYTITFDDGGVSYYTLVADRLEARGWRGACFVPTDFIGTRGFVDVRQIRELDARGHVIGTHSSSHPPRFSALPYEAMVREWRDSRARLEDIVGHAVRAASVPGGYFSAAVARAAGNAGLSALYTSEPITAVQRATAPALLGRFTVRHGDAADAGMRFLAPAPWARAAAWLGWNAKGLIKPILGPAYRHVADWVCAFHTSGTRPFAAVARQRAHTSKDQPPCR